MLRTALIFTFGGLAGSLTIGPLGLFLCALGMLMLVGGMVMSVWRML